MTLTELAAKRASASAAWTGAMFEKLFIRGASGDSTP
jgi:hypothetical protein